MAALSGETRTRKCVCVYTSVLVHRRLIYKSELRTKFGLIPTPKLVETVQSSKRCKFGRRHPEFDRNRPPNCADSATFFCQTRDRFESATTLLEVTLFGRHLHFCCQNHAKHRTYSTFDRTLPPICGRTGSLSAPNRAMLSRTPQIWPKPPVLGRTGSIFWSKLRQLWSKCRFGRAPVRIPPNPQQTWPKARPNLAAESGRRSRGAPGWSNYKSGTKRKARHVGQ